MIYVKLILLGESDSFFTLEMILIFQLHISFHLLEVPLLAKPLGRI